MLVGRSLGVCATPRFMVGEGMVGFGGLGEVRLVRQFPSGSPVHNLVSFGPGGGEEAGSSS